MSLYTCLFHIPLLKGFTNWSKRDFNQFVKACAEYGREDVDAISKEIDGKTPEEVIYIYGYHWKSYLSLY